MVGVRNYSLLPGTNLLKVARTRYNSSINSLTALSTEYGSHPCLLPSLWVVPVSGNSNIDID